MTVENAIRTVSYVGDGLTDSFALPFKFFDPATIIVTLDGVEQIQGSSFLVQGDGQVGGATIEMAVAPANGVVVEAQRVVPYVQEVDLTGQGNFLPETYEDAIDTLEFQIQQLAAEVAALKAKVGP